MKIDTMFRHAREAVKSLRRNSWMTFAAVSAVAVTLLIFGFFLVFAFNVSYWAGELDKQMGVTAFVSQTATTYDVDALKKQISQMPEVKSVEFVPKSAGLEQMKKQWGKDSTFLEGLEGNQNPLPDMFRIVPKNPQKIEELESKIKQLNQIDDADSGDGVSDKLLDLSYYVRIVVLVFGTGLAVLAAFLISNTIKLTIFARRREIEIMRLVGASNWFIRWPFFIEGALIGILGSIVPVTIVLVVYNAFLHIMDAGQGYNFFKALDMWPLSLYVTLLTMALGVVIGVWGSIMSIRRFLKV
ncbi:ABC transporter permease [Polycladomyces sp. WAk]|uniref:Cell division protein FtsX n=1 Tax=Polycladomyces zharkentensis TaxID=2807616 RepID=A0ABS2WES8_9BACL|nr:permease-like cell division protein FtsX [Polycladomyces sp. WAk]MBN2907949.1 ABC transporter permease [Polycladomyces sp. WAk]